MDTRASFIKERLRSMRFTLPKNPDFFSDAFQLALTTESKTLFDLGVPGQGYMCLVEVDTGAIHLAPIFHKDDGLLRLDRNGNKFTRFIEASQPINVNVGEDLHSKCMSILKLKDDDRVISFGLWKAGNNFKFVSHKPATYSIPNEFYVVKNNYGWEVILVEKNRSSSRIVLSDIPHVLDVLNSLPNVPPENLSHAHREKVACLFDREEVPQFKFFKNMGFSGFNSVKYTGNKFYIAGIKFASGSNDNHKKRTKSVIDLIPTIMKDAANEMGRDAVVIANLCEYALTPFPITIAEKKKSLKALRAAVNNYPNLILIPGTFSAYDAFYSCPDKENKSEKMISNYKELLKNKKADGFEVISEEYMQVLSQHRHHFYDTYNIRNAFDDGYYLENCGYLLTKSLTTKSKHKKSAPFEERNVLEFLGIPKDEAVFYIGSQKELVKKIDINGKKLDMSVVVCLEHKDNMHFKQLKKNPPAIQVIVSDYIHRENKALAGALNIQMDTHTDLSILRNEDHFNKAHISATQGMLYTLPNNLSISHCHKKTIDETSISNDRFQFNIANSEDLIALLARCNDSDQLLFAKKYADTLENENELLSLIDVLPPSCKSDYFAWIFPRIEFDLSALVFRNLSIMENELLDGNDTPKMLFELGFTFSDLANCRDENTLLFLLTHLEKIKTYVHYFPNERKKLAIVHLLNAPNDIAIQSVNNAFDLVHKSRVKKYMNILFFTPDKTTTEVPLQAPIPRRALPNSKR